jgi:hypothetical protein
MREEITVNRLLSLVVCLGAAACLDPGGAALDTIDQSLCSTDNDCEPPTSPTIKPRYPTVTARTTSSLTVQFESLAQYTSTALMRRVPNGTWTTIATFGALAGTRTVVDGGRPQDGYYCYRVRATTDTSSGYSDERCGLTARYGSPPVFRVQLRLVVADVSGADTSDALSVYLSEITQPGFNSTGLDYAPVNTGTWVDDFARGRDFTYDLDMASINVLHDISEIKIHKSGTNDLCIASFELLVNNRVAYSRAYGNTATTCRVLSGVWGQPSPTLLVSHAELRAAATFSGFQTPDPVLARCADGTFPCVQVPRLELEQRIEGMIGDIIWGDGRAYWGRSQIYGPRAVEVSRSDADTFHVDVDLAASVDWVPDPEVDIDFDVDVAFETAGTDDFLRLDVNNFDVNVDFGLWADVLGAPLAPVCALATADFTSCVTAVEDKIEQKVEASTSVQSRRIQVVLDPICTAPRVAVLADGSLELGCL